jgi:hypothetical protein
MQIEVAPSNELLKLVLDPKRFAVPVINQADLPYVFIDLPDIPQRGDEVCIRGRYWKVVKRVWHPGTSKPPLIILGLYNEVL